MDITPLIPQGRQIVQSYAEGIFRVSGQVYDGPVIVFTERTIPWPVDKTLNEMSAEDFAPILTESGELDVVLMGCGKTMSGMPFALRQDLKDRGIAVDFMDTGAACRTYNVLMAEGRRVAAALLPV
ncbi:MAG: Mth938-like domain-containing protein [Micavibrio sp.]